MACKCHVLRQDGAIALGHAKKWCTNVEWWQVLVSMEFEDNLFKLIFHTKY